MLLSVKAKIEISLSDLPKSIYGQIIADRINLIYTDTPFDFQNNFSAISNYTDELRKAASEGLEEEEILVVAWQI